LDQIKEEKKRSNHWIKKKLLKKTQKNLINKYNKYNKTIANYLSNHYIPHKSSNKTQKTMK
jgi:hypothetical protein